jgi:hypothetical protein
MPPKEWCTTVQHKTQNSKPLPITAKRSGGCQPRTKHISCMADTTGSNRNQAGDDDDNPNIVIQSLTTPSLQAVTGILSQGHTYDPSSSLFLLIGSTLARKNSCVPELAFKKGFLGR